MLKITYYDNNQVTGTETLRVNATVQDYINAFVNAGANDGVKLRIIGPSRQAMHWLAYIEILGTMEFVKVEGF